ncbi:MAG: ubiquitin-like small modifier protein 1 [Halobacteria archaeon]|nr:ubiquitin-like small modifier protein 1 [Halobacteria archaeon]
METTVRLFANLREAAGESETVVEHEAGDTVGDIVLGLTEEKPELRELLVNSDDEFYSHINFTVDGSKVPASANIDEGGEIAVFPPVSGGSDHEANESHHPHEHHYEDVSRKFAVLTVSSSRQPRDDPSGGLITEILEEEGHSVAEYEILPDDEDVIAENVGSLINSDSIDAVVTTGGTGLTPDDVTAEAVRPLLDKELPGFGEYFRRLSHEEVGTASIMTRATAGVRDGAAIFVLPGNKNAVELGLKEIVLPEINHILELARREE